MGVEFQEEQYKSNFGADGQASTSAIGNWLIKAGLAQDSSSANLIMTIGAVCIFALSIYFFVYGFNLPFSQAPSADVQLPPGLEM